MSATAGFAYIWEFIVKPDQIENFRRAYGPSGDWVRLFSRSAGFVRTDLLEDNDRRGRFVTVDFWTSKEERDAFRDRFRDEFEELDRRCDTLTLEERALGDFELVRPPGAT